jgi:hypothetical protein
MSQCNSSTIKILIKAKEIHKKLLHTNYFFFKWYDTFLHFEHSTVEVENTNNLLQLFG